LRESFAIASGVSAFDGHGAVKAGSSFEEQVSLRGPVGPPRLWDELAISTQFPAVISVRVVVGRLEVHCSKTGGEIFFALPQY